ncbi:MAG: Gfo/Idh/MocA family oxidoreductase [Planctomycetota bacterium]
MNNLCDFGLPANLIVSCRDFAGRMRARLQVLYNTMGTPTTTDSALDSAGQPPLRLALVGVGGIASAHLGAIAQLAEQGQAELVAAVDASVEALAKLPESVARCEHVNEFAEHGIDAAIVCTPPSARIELIEPLLSAGIAVLCEKPLARTPEEAEDLVRLAAEHDTISAVAYCHRFTPAVVEMKRRLDEGQLGELIRFENTFACWHPTLVTKWMSDPTVSGGGSFIDTGCHSLDLLNFLCGDATMQAAVLNHTWPGRGESNATVLLQTESGAAAAIASGWQEGDRFTVTLVGAEGTLHYDYLDGEVIRWTPSHDAPAQNITVETHDVRFTRQLAAFVHAVRTGDASALCSFEQASVVAQQVDTAYALAGSTTTSAALV